MDPNQIIISSQFGSHLYGLNTPESDVDYKGIFMPTKRQVLLQQVPKSEKWSTGDNNSSNTSQDKDYEYWSLNQFVSMALKGETEAIDFLHAWQMTDQGPSDERGITSVNRSFEAVWKELVTFRKMLYTSSMKSYLGYVRRQAAKYGVKGSRLHAANEVYEALERIPTPGEQASQTRLSDVADLLPENEYAGWQGEFYMVCGRKIEKTVNIYYAFNVVRKIVYSYGDRAKKAKNNEGIDWKAVSHALRAGYQLLHIYTEGDFEYPLPKPETEYLLEVKKGERDFKTDAQPALENLVEEVSNLANKSQLPQEPDQEFWNRWLMNVMEEYVLT